MRVITGTARGCKLRTLDGNDVRPTTERVKEAMFSAIQFDIDGRRVLDLFSGSGQLGIESLSRGADSAVFIDSANASLEVTRENLVASKLDGKGKVLRTDFRSYLQMTPDRFDIAFLDPPYGTGMLQEALGLLDRVMTDYAVIVCEHPATEIMPAESGRFASGKVHRFGKIAFTVYRRKEM